LIIYDNSIKYDTEFIDVVMAKEERTSIERDIANAFFRHAYYLYNRIRDCVNPRKCRSVTLSTVKERLQDPDKLELTVRLTQLKEEQIHYIVDYNEKYNEYIRK